MRLTMFFVGALAGALRLGNAQAVEWLVVGLVVLLVAGVVLIVILLRSDRPLKFRHQDRTGAVSSFTIEFPRRKRRS